MAFRRKRQTGPEPTESGSMFLGAAVAHDISETANTRLAPEFVELVESFNRSLSRYRAGEISAAELGRILADTKVTDTSGATWTLGATSGAWYRRTAHFDWVQVPPPGPGVRGAALAAVGAVAASPAAAAVIERPDVTDVDLVADPNPAALIEPLTPSTPTEPQPAEPGAWDLPVEHIDPVADEDLLRRFLGE
jgi:hypothetical protein